jgi:hypothetical protein
VVAPTIGHNRETERSAIRPSCCSRDTYPKQKESPQDQDTAKNLSHFTHPVFSPELRQIAHFFESPDQDKKVFGTGMPLCHDPGSLSSLGKEA